MTSPITPGLKSALQQALADKKITLEEWQQNLEPIVDSEAPVASGDSHAILTAWASDKFDVDPQVRQWMHDYLRSRGYQMPDARPQGESNAQVIRELSKTNVGETDPVFAAVAKATGHSQAGVNVAVIDSGFDLFHPELGHKGAVNPGDAPSDGIDQDHNGKTDDSNGWNFVDWNNDVGNPYGDWHGTHVAGLATAGTDQISVIPLRVLPGTSPFEPQKMSDAIDYAAEHGAKILSMSFAVNTPEKFAAVKAAIERHPEMMFVIACGNDGQPLSSYDPNTFLNSNGIRLPNLVAVAASDATGAKAGFSNFGPEAGLAARGDNVLSTIPGAQYNTITGTSMAAPTVSNAAAKCLLLDPALNPEQLQKMLAVTSDVRDDWKGMVAAGGPINSDRAVRLAGLTGLVRGGMSPQDAATKLHLTQADTARLLPLVAQFA